MSRIVDLIISYRYSLIKILLFEIFYIILGYKGNKFINRNSELATDTIPCPYFFLHKIANEIKRLNIKSITDIGCGNGRVINFFNKKLHIQLNGYEIFSDSYNFCSKYFKSYKNVKIYNTNFFHGDYLKGEVDCYFINDPVKDTIVHRESFKKLLKAVKSGGKVVHFILINMSPKKLEIFKELNFVSSYRAGKKGFFIYKSNNK